jgi:hypothetical protein
MIFDSSRGSNLGWFGVAASTMAAILAPTPTEGKDGTDVTQIQPPGSNATFDGGFYRFELPALLAKENPTARPWQRSDPNSENGPSGGVSFVTTSSSGGLKVSLILALKTKSHTPGVLAVDEAGKIFRKTRDRAIENRVEGVVFLRDISEELFKKDPNTPGAKGAVHAFVMKTGTPSKVAFVKSDGHSVIEGTINLPVELQLPGNEKEHDRLAVEIIKSISLKEKPNGK